MATSGSTDFNLNAREVVTFALRKLGIVDGVGSASADDVALGIENLNVMLKGWQMSGPNLWRMTEGSQALSNATASYALSVKPYRILSARYRSAASIDTPMELLTRDEYYDLPLKSSSGIPTQFYFDRQVSTGTLFVWPVLASATTETIRYTYQRVFEDIDALTNDIDIPAEHLGLVGYWLALMIAPDFGIDDRRYAQIERMAAQLMIQHKDSDREAVYRLEPAGRR